MKRSIYRPRSINIDPLGYPAKVIFHFPTQVMMCHSLRFGNVKICHISASRPKIIILIPICLINVFEQKAFIFWIFSHLAEMWPFSGF